MTVPADERAVEAYILGLEARGERKFRAQKVLFFDAVFFFQNLQKILFDRLVVVLFAVRNVAEPDVEVFALYRLAERFCVLLGGKVRQKVAYVKHGVAFLFAYLDGDYFAVLFSDYAVKSERNGSPLIFADSAVIMGFGKSHAVVLVQRHLF